MILPSSTWCTSRFTTYWIRALVTLFSSSHVSPWSAFLAQSFHRYLASSFLRPTSPSPLGLLKPRSQIQYSVFCYHHLSLPLTKYQLPEMVPFWGPLACYTTRSAGAPQGMSSSVLTWGIRTPSSVLSWGILTFPPEFSLKHGVLVYRSGLYKDVAPFSSTCSCPVAF